MVKKISIKKKIEVVSVGILCELARRSIPQKVFKANNKITKRSNKNVRIFISKLV
jgi:hypothetical protein